MRRFVLTLLSTLVMSGSVVAAPIIRLDRVASGLQEPLGIVAPGDHSGRLFIIEQRGRIRVLRGSTLLTTPFLDLSDRVSCCGERGLLGLAFHPQYAANGRFFVNYTNSSGDTEIAEFHVSANPESAEGNGRLLLRVSQPFANHNGGNLAFGPDGYLYIGLGDGGSGGDPGNRAQDLTTLLGKMLRIDVDGAQPYATPPDNPFVGRSDARPEIWSYGLRNPWRYSFDRETGDLFIADVGQNAREEIDLQPRSSRGGENWGWRRMEGTACFSPASGCNPDNALKLPILDYDRSLGCSVTGGYRYRGVRHPHMRGYYIFGDFCSGRIFAAEEGANGWSMTTLVDTTLSISAFGEDDDGEILVASYGTGEVFRIVDQASARKRPARPAR